MLLLALLFLEAYSTESVHSISVHVTGTWLAHDNDLVLCVCVVLVFRSGRRGGCGRSILSEVMCQSVANGTLSSRLWARGGKRREENKAWWEREMKWNSKRGKKREGRGGLSGQCSYKQQEPSNVLVTSPHSRCRWGHQHGSKTPPWGRSPSIGSCAWSALWCSGQPEEKKEEMMWRRVTHSIPCWCLCYPEQHQSRPAQKMALADSWKQAHRMRQLLGVWVYNAVYWLTCGWQTKEPGLPPSSHLLTSCPWDGTWGGRADMIMYLIVSRFIADLFPGAMQL